MPHALGPGEFPECGLTFFIHKDPLVLTSPGSAPVLVRSPPTGFPGMASLHVPLGAVVHETVQPRKDLLGHAGTEVIAPASDHRVHGVDQGHGGGPHLSAPNPFEFPSDLLDGVLTGFDQQLVAAFRALRGQVMPDIESQEIEAFEEMTDAGLIFR